MRALSLVCLLSFSAGASLSGRYLSLPLGARTCNAYASGARGDGRSDDTAALQRALALCGTAAGGTVLLPSNGTFLSFALTLPATAVGTALQIEGTLRFSNATQGWGKAPKACLTLAGANIALFGAGVVDGQGAAWWPCAKAGCARPNLLNAQVTSLLIKDLTFLDSPNHNLELYSSPLEVANVTILAPPSTGVPNPSHNTDGIGACPQGACASARMAPGSSPQALTAGTAAPPLPPPPPPSPLDVHGSPAYIHSSHISTGDDHIAMHANDTLIEDCTFGTGHGASIGSLGAGTYLRNITVRSSSFKGATTALRIKADNASSGTLRGVVFRDLSMQGVGVTLALQSTYPAPSGPSGSTLAMSDIVFANITSAQAGAAGSLLCSALAPCTGLALSDIVHTGSPPPLAWDCANAQGTAQAPVTPPLGGCLGHGS